MSPKFTAHGKDRAIERGITPEEIDSILAAESTLIARSNKDEMAALAMGISSAKLWVVVYNIGTGEIITVRRADKKERRLYEQQKGN